MIVYEFQAVPVTKENIMKKSPFAALLAAVMLLAGCSSEAVEAEIKIPILEGDSSKSYHTAKAELYDISTDTTIGAAVEYPFAETYSINYDTNLLEYNVKKGDVLQEGDIIAVFDSSALSYDLRNQQIAADSAYSSYLASGSRAAQIAYEEQAKLLELVQYRVDEYTIKAPYDCVVVTAEHFETGQAVEAGTPVVTIAKPDEVYVTVERDRDNFAFGKQVKLKFGTNSSFGGRVAMMPENGREKVLIAFDEGELERAKEEAGNIISAGWATVIVQSFSKHAALCIPKDAVMQYSGTTYCYIEENGERARIQIETGETVNDLTIVRSGLSEGDVVSY